MQRRGKMSNNGTTSTTNSSTSGYDPQTAVFDPIDEDKQGEIVKTIKDEASAQMQEMISIFGVICLVATVACLGLSFGRADATRLGRIHAMLASCLHFLARHHSIRSDATSSSCFSSSTYSCWWQNKEIALAMASPGPLLVLLSFSLTRTFEELEFHWSLGLGNLLTSTAAHFLRRENQSTAKAISDLHASKYRYKSL